MRTHLLATVVTLASLTITIGAKAADPILGTWKLNIAESKFSPILQAFTKQGPPREHTETYREVEGNQIEFTAKEIRADGSPTLFRYVVPLQGGTVKILEGGIEGLSYVEAIIDSDWHVIALRDGKQIGLRRKTVSKDGKTMLQTVTATDPQGRRIEQSEVYDRQ